MSVLLFFPLLFASIIALAGVGGATPAGEAERGVGLAMRGPDEGRERARKLTTFPVSDQDGLYQKISTGCFQYDSSCTQGSASMSDGDEVVAAEGVYQCGTCFDSDRMYSIYSLNGVIRCENDDLQCKLDGQGSRTVMFVDDTGGGTLSLRGFHIYRGLRGIDIGITGCDVLILSIMRFTECGEWAILASYSCSINIYAVDFSGNLREFEGSYYGADIYSSSHFGSVTIHDTCPPDMLGGAPTQGESDHPRFLLADFPPTYPLTLSLCIVTPSSQEPPLTRMVPSPDPPTRTLRGHAPRAP